MQSTRRSFLSQSLLALFASVPGFRLCAAEKQKFPGWNPGELDLHFIYTGCGENCFFRLPDGTAVLNDGGEFYRPRDLRHIPLLPHAKLLGGEWTSRYIQKMYPEKTLDYAVFSHWHSDHIGHSSYDKPRRPEADFRFRTLPDGRKVNGFLCVAEDFKVKCHIDHEYPEWGRYKTGDSSFKLLTEWVEGQRANGLVSIGLQPGALNQIALQRDPAKYPDFSVRTLCANGRVWDGKDGVRDCAGDSLKVKPSFRPSANSLSAAYLYKYGKFSFFTGGDVSGKFLNSDGSAYDYDELVGKVAGPVTLCKMNHHGCSDAMGEAFVRQVKAQTYVSCIWCPGQVSDVTMNRMASSEIHDGRKPLIIPNLMPARQAMMYNGRPFMSNIPMQAAEGVHVVVKVFPGGDRYRVYLLNAASENMWVLATFDRETA